MAARNRAPFGGDECAARLAAAGDAGELLLALPQTFMNRSGYAVRCLAERYAIAPSAVLVVFDEVALPLGRLRLRAAGGAGGHRGMESVLENLRSDDVPRLRLGVGPVDGLAAGRDLSNFVLAPFDPGERATVELLVERAADAIELWSRDGVSAAMGRFNG